MSSRFLDHVGLDMHGHRKKTAFFLEVLERRRQHDGREARSFRVLELGCGNGHVVALPLAEAGYHVTGVDIHEESIQAARAANPFPHARFVVGDVRQPEVGGGYDAVVLADVLEHVEEPSALLEAARDALADGGIVLVSIPNGYGPYEAEQWLEQRGLLRPALWAIRRAGRLRRRGRSRPASPQLAYNAASGHVQHFSRRRFASLLAAAGLRVFEHRNGSLLGGELSQYAFRAAPWLVPATLWLADRLPAAAVSTWYFACAAENDGD